MKPYTLDIDDERSYPEALEHLKKMIAGESTGPLIVVVEWKNGRAMSRYDIVNGTVVLSFSGERVPSAMVKSTYYFELDCGRGGAGTMYCTRFFMPID